MKILDHQNWIQGCKALSVQDPVIENIIQKYKGEILRSKENSFETLMRSIVGQQVSVKAADTIWNRLVAVLQGSVDTASDTSTEARSGYPGRSIKVLQPKVLLKVEITKLREAGLSQRKAEYVKELALAFEEKRLDPKTWKHLTDEEVVQNLIQIRGIGRWTAEMFLIFHLLRPNVFPEDDLGLQKAISIHYGHRYPLSSPILKKYRKRFDPWASVATWYLWRSLDPVPVEY